ncbi:hypothetical protein ACLOJK_002192 [Asimina triloba]
MADLQPPPSEAPINGPPPPENFGASLVVSKRQRRPSVRLGDIGEQSAAATTYDAYIRKGKPWKGPGGAGPPKDSVGGKTSSKTRPLVNIGNGELHEVVQEGEEKNLPSGDLDSVIGSWKKDLKMKRGPAVAGATTATKRVRSNWMSRIEEGAENDEKVSGFNIEEEEEEEDDGGFRDYGPEGSVSPSKERSPIHSMENTGGRDWKCGTTSAERNGMSERRCRSLDDGVRMWLNGLGLGRYASVFELHEVDDEVLPLLTLEDLKDMGINAVGSRRKMYCAIQRLGKGFT